VVEDDDSVRRALARVFVTAGYSVVLAANGSEGLEALGTVLRPCLVILDWKMPGVDGPGFLAGLAERPDRGSFGVIVISGEERRIDRKISSNVLSILRKPLDPSEILGWACPYFRAEDRSSGGLAYVPIAGAGLMGRPQYR